MAIGAEYARMSVSKAKVTYAHSGVEVASERARSAAAQIGSYQFRIGGQQLREQSHCGRPVSGVNLNGDTCKQI